MDLSLFSKITLLEALTHVNKSQPFDNTYMILVTYKMLEIVLVNKSNKKIL